MDLFHLRSVLLWVDVDELPQVVQARQSNFQLISTTRKGECDCNCVSANLFFDARDFKKRRVMWEIEMKSSDSGVSAKRKIAGWKMKSGGVILNGRLPR